MSHSIQYDVVIAGAGTCGALLANKLGQAGFRVLVLEVGNKSYFELDPTHPLGTDRRQPLLDRFFSLTARVPNGPYPNLKHAPVELENTLGKYYTGPAYDPERTKDAPPQFKSTYTRMVGGTMHHWLGTALRYMPNTFREKTLYGRGADWPISYNELEDWYWLAEQEIGVSGDSDDDLGSPRFGKKFPMPKILPSYMDQRFAERTAGMTFDGLPVLVRPTPQARNSVPYQDRPPCTGAANCIPICPVQAKYDATVHLKRALQPKLDPHDRPGSQAATLQHDAVVTRVCVGTEGDGGGARVTKLMYKSSPDGVEHEVKARMYVLAAHAIENAKILLMSPWGERKTVANTSDAVGRHLMDHNIKIAVGLADEPLYPFRGPKSTAGVESLRDGEFRKHRGAFRVEIQGVSANWYLNTPFSNLQAALNANLMGEELYQRLGWDVNRTVQIGALIEPEPQWNSTIRPSKDKFDALGVPRPEINFVIDEYTQRGAAAFEVLATRILRAMGAKDGEIAFNEDFEGAGHVMGTHRMGDDPLVSVTDSFGRTWDHDNLWLSGSGLFPTVDSANPTLTLVALTLRQAERMIGVLRGKD